MFSDSTLQLMFKKWSLVKFGIVSKKNTWGTFG